MKIQAIPCKITFSAVTTLVASLSLSVPAKAANIVNLDPGDAVSDILGGGSGTQSFTSTGVMTVNITFTPNATDFTRGYSNDGDGTNDDSVNLWEVGASQRGQGLYLANGIINWVGYSTSFSGLGTNYSLDTDYDDGRVWIQSSFGTLTADTEYSVAAIFNFTDLTLDLGIQPTGGSLFTESYTFTGTPTDEVNWDGNDSLSTFTQTTGAAGSSTNWIDENKALNGTAGRSLAWDQDGTIVVPEPSSFALLAGCFGLTWVMLRRRC